MTTSWTFPSWTAAGCRSPCPARRRWYAGAPTSSPARAGAKEVRFHWPSHPWTKGSYASYLAGQWTTIAGAEAESVDGLHFAGEHCSLEAQGFMEGGCETGEAAARAVLERRGVAVPAALVRTALPRAS